MQILSDRPEMIFRNERDGKIFYSMGIKKKNRDGEYINGYIPIQFKKGIGVENQTLINIKKGWIDFYKKDNKTVPYIFICDFEKTEKNMKEV